MISNVAIPPKPYYYEDDEELEEWEIEYEQERLIKDIANDMFFKNIAFLYNTAEHGRQIYRALLRRTKKVYNCHSEVAYKIVNYYFDNEIEQDFDKWLHSDDAPFVCRFRDIGKIFPEIKEITDNKKEIIEIANKIYNLHLDYTYDYGYGEYEDVYQLKFNFNDFTPINLKEIKDIKQEIEFCKKYQIDYQELKDKLKSFNLDDDFIENL